MIARLASLVAVVSLLANIANAAPLTRRLAWSDEFRGSAIDHRCWTAETRYPSNAEADLQRFTESPANIDVRNGMLYIQALKQPTGDGKEYTSAQLRTDEKAHWTYGYFEARIKVPSGEGAFPAFWMMPQTNVYGGHPRAGEMDIFETVGRFPKTAFAALHFEGSNWRTDGADHDLAQPLADDFHVFGLEWLPHRMRWFVDGKQVWERTSWPSPAGAPAGAPFDKPFYLLLDLAIGGDWAHAPTPETVFPMQMLVDYVRVYSIDGVSDPEPMAVSNDPRTCPLHGPSGRHLMAVGNSMPVWPSQVRQAPTS